MTMKVVLSCPIIDCDEGERHKAFTTPVMGTQGAVEYLSMHCKYSHAHWRGAISAQYLDNVVSETNWLHFLSSWAAYRSLECGGLGSEELFTHLMDMRLLRGLGVATLIRIRWDALTILTDIQLLDEVALELWGRPEDPKNAVIASPVKEKEVVDKPATKNMSKEPLRNRSAKRKRAKLNRKKKCLAAPREGNQHEC